ncbi:hypothetical protein BLNAU_5065 [Blattamonas nauphoetae]|uniref:Uncharacterized protein n=1 Tax=Blattamonas nauphoetae TaxID=2049346 RepID=A0ABQ9Y800_9EUKA|nr:hypothetical protein BLNAU_5065 [Blattamonas nauphoetae]
MENIVLAVSQLLAEQHDRLSAQFKEEIAEINNEKQSLMDQVQSLKQANQEMKFRLDEQEILLKTFLRNQQQPTRKNTASAEQHEITPPTSRREMNHHLPTPQSQTDHRVENSTRKQFTETQPPMSHQDNRDTIPTRRGNRREIPEPQTISHPRFGRTSSNLNSELMDFEQSIPHPRPAKKDLRGDDNNFVEEEKKRKESEANEIRQLEEDIMAFKEGDRQHDITNHDDTSSFLSSIVNEFTEGPKTQENIPHSSQQENRENITPLNSTRTAREKAYPFSSPPPHSSTIKRSPSPPRIRPAQGAAFAPLPDDFDLSRGGQSPRRGRNFGASQNRSPNSHLKPRTTPQPSPHRPVSQQISSFDTPTQHPWSQTKQRGPMGRENDEPTTPGVQHSSPPSMRALAQSQQHQKGGHSTLPSRTSPYQKQAGSKQNHTQRQPSQQMEPKDILSAARSRLNERDYKEFLHLLKNVQEEKVSVPDAKQKCMKLVQGNDEDLLLMMQELIELA